MAEQDTGEVVQFPLNDHTRRRIMESNPIPMQKRQHCVWMVPQTKAFSIETREGKYQAQAGDWVAYDSVTGDIWPVSNEYVKLHYEEFKRRP